MRFLPTRLAYGWQASGRWVIPSSSAAWRQQALAAST
jgi:hypothetical protein